MSGNLNSGRRAAPPRRQDALSEALVDAFAELNALALERKKHDQRQRAAEHRIAAFLKDAWNQHVGAYDPASEPKVAA